MRLWKSLRASRSESSNISDWRGNFTSNLFFTFSWRLLKRAFALTTSAGQCRWCVLRLLPPLNSFLHPGHLTRVIESRQKRCGSHLGCRRNLSFVVLKDKSCDVPDLVRIKSSTDYTQELLFLSPSIHPFLKCRAKRTIPLPSPRRSVKHSDVVKSMSIILSTTSIWTHTVIRAGVLKPYLDKSCSIAPCIHPFASIQRAFYAGVPEAASPEEQDDE